MTPLLWRAIGHRNEETQCRCCGYPLYIGDKALCDGHGVFCSPRCAALYSDGEKGRGVLEGMEEEGGDHDFA